MCTVCVCFVCFSSQYNLKNICLCMHSCVTQVRLLCFPLNVRKHTCWKGKQTIFFSESVHGAHSVIMFYSLTHVIQLLMGILK